MNKLEQELLEEICNDDPNHICVGLEGLVVTTPDSVPVDIRVEGVNWPALVVFKSELWPGVLDGFSIEDAGFVNIILANKFPDYSIRVDLYYEDRFVYVTWYNVMSSPKCVLQDWRKFRMRLVDILSLADEVGQSMLDGKEIKL